MFLEILNLTESELALGDSALLAVLLPFLLASLVLISFVAIGIYIFTAFVFMAIARKAKYKTPEIAWIPIVGPLIITSNIAKMHWWPILLLAGMWIPFVGWAFSLVVGVFSIIWMWKTFEAINKPGWWAIMSIIPVVNIAYPVLLGIAAWSKK